MFVIRKVGVTTRERKEDTPYVRGMRIVVVTVKKEDVLFEINISVPREKEEGERRRYAQEFTIPR